MFTINRLIAKYLRELADKFEVNTSEVSESQAIDILRVVAHEAMSKAQAYEYLRISRSKFDALVSDGVLPKGVSTVGRKELTWWRDELDLAVRKLRTSKNI